MSSHGVMAVKLLSREQVALERKNAAGPVNALGFPRLKVAKNEGESDFGESKLQGSRSPRRTGRGDSSERPVATTDESDSSEMRMPRHRHSQRYQPGVADVSVPRMQPQPSRPGRYERWTQTRRVPRVSQRVRQLQAQHESELSIQFKKKRARKLEKKTECDETKNASKISKSTDSLGSDKKAAFSEVPVQPLPDPLGVQSDPTYENQTANPAESVTSATSGTELPPRVDLADPAHGKERVTQPQSCSSLPKAPSQPEKRQDAKQGAHTAPRALTVPGVALKRWRQARKRQHLLRQMNAMNGEMKFERRQLVSALQRPFNFATFEAELQKHNRDLKVRFQSLYRKMSSERKEKQTRLRVLKVLEAEHTELQRAFAKLMNHCGFARPSALRAPGDHKTMPEADEEDDDDDVIVEEIQETEEIPEPDSKKEELKKEMQREALRAELLLRALDAGKSQ